MKTIVTKAALAAATATAAALFAATASFAAEDCIDAGWQKIPGSNACHYTGFVNVTAQRSGDASANEHQEPNVVERRVVDERDDQGNPISFRTAGVVTDLGSLMFDGVRK